MATRLYIRALVAGSRPTAGEKSTVQPANTLGALNASGFGEEGLSLRLEKQGFTERSISKNSDATTAARSNYLLRATSEPLAAGTFGSGTWNVALALLETNAAANSFLNLSVYVWRPGTSAVVGFIYDSSTNIGAEWGATEDGVVTTFAGSNVTAQAGDVLVCEVWRKATQSMGTAYAQAIFFDGGTDVVDATTTDAASYIEAPGTIAFADGALPRYIASLYAGTISTTLVIAKPTGTTTDDVILFFVNCDDGVSTITPPANVNSIRKTVFGSEVLESFWTRAGAETNYTFTADTTPNHFQVVAEAFRGLGTAGSPVDVSAEATANANNLSAPALTTASANERYVAAWVMEDSGVSLLLDTAALIDCRVDRVGSAVFYVIGDRLVASPGSTGPYTATWDAVVDILVHAIALRVPVATKAPPPTIFRHPRYSMGRRYA